MTKFRGWCFTVNNPDAPLDEDDIAAEYLIYQLEMGEETGLPHFQGFMYFVNARSFESVVAKLPHGAHVEPAKSIEKSIVYCSKEKGRLEGPYEYGQRPAQGSRSDLTEAIDSVSSGMLMSDVARQYPSTYVRYHRGLQAYRTVTSEPRSEATTAVSIVGPTGIGKTSQVFNEYPDAYWKTQDEWWDGYDGQDVVVLDEFYGWLPLSFMLRLIDRTPLRVATKGGFVNFSATKLIILSNKHLEDWYPGLSGDVRLPALKRRVQQCVMDSSGVHRRLFSVFDPPGDAVLVPVVPPGPSSMDALTNEY